MGSVIPLKKSANSAYLESQKPFERQTRQGRRANSWGSKVM